MHFDLMFQLNEQFWTSFGFYNRINTEYEKNQIGLFSYLENAVKMVDNRLE